MAGDRTRSDDELAETATATPNASAVPATTATAVERPAPTRDSGLRDQLGRYQIGRELGRGGMGVVHSAFDPDLERKIALKVLPAEVESVDARQRLLREARAMARLSHPNVVTVHEVGSALGRDFIAMELIDGTTLEDWLEASPRTEHEVLSAFIAAGRGLAAAHAAGLVHRDFKPRNVLRHKDGRIVVTDFGLVVGVEGEGVDAFKITLPSGPVSAKTTPSSLSGLTKTGSVLGTPAYMAPEQWTGGQVGPAADQFAFCVALWEALAKERPYKGSTVEELKAVVLAGKRTDEAKIPRKLRKVLRRGLDPDPARRYPNMTALLDAVTRTERRPTVVFAGVGAAVVAAVVVYAVAIRSHGPNHTTYIRDACTAPVLAPEKVWTARDAEILRAAHQGLTAASLERDFKSWIETRARACKVDASVREPQLACLDGALSRIDAVKQIVVTSKLSETVEIDDLLVQPTVCQTPKPPRLARVLSKEYRDVLAFYLQHADQGPSLTEADTNGATARAGNDPCATAIAHELAAAVIGGDRNGELAEADRDAQACGDDRMIADIAVTNAMLAGALADVDFRTKMEKAETLTARVRQPDIDAQLEVLRSVLATLSDDLDGTILHLEKSIALYEQRDMIRTAFAKRLDVHRWRMRRAKPADFTGAPMVLENLRKEVVAKLGETDPLVREVDRARATVVWLNGDLEGANKLRQAGAKSEPAKKPQLVSGQVVDDNGPVAGAQVWVGTGMFADSLYATVAGGGDQRTVMTDADGRFTIKDAEAKSLLVAQHGDLRAAPVWAGDNMTVKLQPTSAVSGKVELHGRMAQQVTFYVVPKDQAPEFPYMLSAPLAADGSFVLRGVPRGEMVFATTVELAQTQLSESHDVAVTKPEVTGVRIEVKASGRPLVLLVRSPYGTPLATANVFVIAGKQPAEMSLAKVFTSRLNFSAKLASKPLPEQDVATLHARMKPGDLYARIAERPDGVVSACAFPLPEHLDDPELVSMQNDIKKLEKLPVRCVPVAATDDLVVVPVAPWPRFD